MSIFTHEVTSLKNWSGYLNDGCQKITLVGVKDDRKIEFKNEIQLCKN